jgi:hypothetical protein
MAARAGIEPGVVLITNYLASKIAQFNAHCLTNSMLGDVGGVSRGACWRENVDRIIDVLQCVAHENDDGEGTAKQLCEGTHVGFQRRGSRGDATWEGCGKGRSRRISQPD